MSYLIWDKLKKKQTNKQKQKKHCSSISDFKVNISVDIAQSEQWYDKSFNIFLLHMLNHALKDVDMLNYKIINNMNSLYPANIYFFEVNIRTARKRWGNIIIVKTPNRRQHTFLQRFYY